MALSALVGLERDIRQKSAGLRPYTLAGVSAALFMLVSKYGFVDVLPNGRVVVDPARDRVDEDGIVLSGGAPRRGSHGNLQTMRNLHGLRASCVLATIYQLLRQFFALLCARYAVRRQVDARPATRAGRANGLIRASAADLRLGARHVAARRAAIDT